LTLAGIGLNRKVLSEMAIAEPEGFAQVVERARQALPQA
jgi:large subunit ribosomal protein L20